MNETNPLSTPTPLHPHTPTPSINISIERLILDGISIPHAQRPLLQASVEAELGRLLAVGGLGNEWRSPIAVPGISTPTIQLSPDGNPTQWGHQIAHAVYQGISPKAASTGN
ncbi:hypothetical protein IQ274_27745 [Nostoc sp. LEGE 12447]|uniref:hypothetical protein n=1 Tax=Nostoc sp. LEGE 12447 TaxID=1828640 RepID=UPI0016889021|nr:hypothetical protein [Nostoc sp. LEGE 12447]MBD2511491.1 hypothetical protein [Desmonostoc muscorum FACHB-395]MBE9001891.1 hypothetical protein [Nostoc sp. LEGE 12447]